MLFVTIEVPMMSGKLSNTVDTTLGSAISVSNSATF